ncbi:MAG: hypothetical protein AB2556_09370 [Candidatus Thiodiazotropha sp.]
MALKQQLLSPVTNLQSRDQDEIAWLPGLYEALPPEAARKHLLRFSALDLVGLQADSLLESFEGRILRSVVHLDLFIVIVCGQTTLAEPVVWHLTRNPGRLFLVAAAFDLDASTIEPIEEGFQDGARHSADLVPDDHAGNEFLSHPFGRPLGLATPA